VPHLGSGMLQPESRGPFPLPFIDDICLFHGGQVMGQSLYL
jgi:hypothetical protein